MRILGEVMVYNQLEDGKILSQKFDPPTNLMRIHTWRIGNGVDALLAHALSFIFQILHSASK